MKNERSFQKYMREGFQIFQIFLIAVNELKKNIAREVFKNVMREGFQKNKYRK